MKGETQQGNQRFWLARDGGVSWGAGLSVLKPGRSQANRDSWSPSHGQPQTQLVKIDSKPEVL